MERYSYPRELPKRSSRAIIESLFSKSVQEEYIQFTDYYFLFDE